MLSSLSDMSVGATQCVFELPACEELFSPYSISEHMHVGLRNRTSIADIQNCKNICTLLFSLSIFQLFRITSVKERERERSRFRFQHFQLNHTHRICRLMPLSIQGTAPTLPCLAFYQNSFILLKLSKAYKVKPRTFTVHINRTYSTVS